MEEVIRVKQITYSNQKVEILHKLRFMNIEGDNQSEMKRPCTPISLRLLFFSPPDVLDGADLNHDNELLYMLQTPPSVSD